jgi:dihydrofolate synthase/folylpolyglutamate synthase
LKRGCPVYCASLPREEGRVMAARAKALRAPLTVVRPWKASRVDWRGGRQAFGGAWLSLLGDGQGSNVALARTALDGLRGILPVGENAWRAGLARVEWPGRFTVRRAGRRTLVLDGAHNPEAMGSLARTWSRSPWARRKTRWIMGLMRDKDAAGMLAPVAPFLREVVTVRPPSPRALDAVTLAREVRRAAPRAHVSVESDPTTALRSWLSDGGPSTAVVCGSFYLVGAANRALRGGHAAA